MKTQTILLLDQQEGADIEQLKNMFATSADDTQVKQIFSKEEFDSLLNQCKNTGSPFRAPCPVLIIVDVDFPTTTDGLEVLDSIKKSTQLSTVPLLIFTNNDNKDTVANCYVRGANGYYLKPSTDSEINTILSSLKSRWQRLSQRGFGYSYKAV